MHIPQLEILRCPYCGGSFALDEDATLRRADDEIVTGVLRCACASFPVIDGIPLVIAAYMNDASLQQLIADDADAALVRALELDEERQAAFQQLRARGDAATYRDWIEVFTPGSEGPYFIHRFANPTYLVGQTILRAVGGNAACFARRAIDLAGGSGHLTRVLCELSGDAEVWLAENSFWKVWIARRITAPRCVPICCDAEAPLPFAPGTFSLAFCSDAFHYVWSKRQFAGEMMRLVGEDGVIVINHAHNALQPGHSMGLPLAPGGWRGLLQAHGARLFPETMALESVINRTPLDLSREFTDEELNGEQAVFTVAARAEAIFCAYDFPGAQLESGEWRINPLYEVEVTSEGVQLQLRFPSESYEDEYQVCKRYLPETLTLSAAAMQQLARGELNDELRQWTDRYVIINAPRGYL